MKVVLLIDGGHLRAVSGKARIEYTPDFIEAFAHSCIDLGEHEKLLRILYYDCPRYRGKKSKPISGEMHNFQATDTWLEDIAVKNYFAVRRGTLAWRGWQLKKDPPVTGKALSDADFRPNFEQKGVDMRIGLDIASISAEKSVDRIILVSADTDMIPAMKHARKSGMQVVGVQLPMPPSIALTKHFLAHTDFRRSVGWPAEFQPGSANAAPDEPC